MIHIKETEIIPLLKEAQTEYSQKITEGDPKDVEMAERIEEALTQAMDIVYDYQSMTDEHMLVATEYIVRRLTPLECCRLQGFPDNWAEELGIPEPIQEDIDHWREVFRTQIEAMGESKKEKTDNQICKWLKDPESDSAKYKMWGNGIALPCAMFVMEGIAMILSEEDADEQK